MRNGEQLGNSQPARAPGYEYLTDEHMAETETNINSETGKERTFSEFDNYPKQKGESNEEYGDRLESNHEKAEAFRAEAVERAKREQEEREKQAYFASDEGKRELAEEARYDRLSEKLDQAVNRGGMTEEHADKLLEQQLERSVKNIEDARLDYKDHQAVGTPEEEAAYEKWLKKHDEENMRNLVAREERADGKPEEVSVRIVNKEDSAKEPASVDFSTTNEKVLKVQADDSKAPEYLRAAAQSELTRRAELEKNAPSKEELLGKVTELQKQIDMLLALINNLDDKPSPEIILEPKKTVEKEVISAREKEEMEMKEKEELSKKLDKVENGDGKVELVDRKERRLAEIEKEMEECDLMLEKTDAKIARLKEAKNAVDENIEELEKEIKRNEKILEELFVVREKEEKEEEREEGKDENIVRIRVESEPENDEQDFLKTSIKNQFADIAGEKGLEFMLSEEGLTPDRSDKIADWWAELSADARNEIAQYELTLGKSTVGRALRAWLQGQGLLPPGVL